MSCIDITLSVVSSEVAVTCTSLSASPAISAVQSPQSPIKLQVKSLSQSPDFMATSQHSASVTASEIKSPLMIVFTKICTLAKFISCIGNGFWINEQPWINNEKWDNE